MVACGFRGYGIRQSEVSNIFPLNVLSILDDISMMCLVNPSPSPQDVAARLTDRLALRSRPQMDRTEAKRK